MLRSRVYQKVLGNFGLLIVILIAMTVLVTNVLHQMESHYQYAALDVEYLGKIEHLRTNLEDIPEYLDFYQKTKAPEYKAIFLTSLNDFTKSLEELKAIPQDTIVQQTIYQVETIFHEWVIAVAEKRIALAQINSTFDSAEIESAALDTLEVREHYLTTCRSLVSSVYQKLLSTQERRIQNASTLGTDVSRFILLVNILFAIFAVALGFFLTRNITKPLELLREGTRSIMESKFISINVNRSDEFGELARDFNRMAEMLQENYSRIKAYSDIMTTLNQNETLTGVVSESLELLCQQSRAGIGALYIYNEQEERLSRASGFAMMNEKEANVTYKLGEGIPGECARLKKPIEIIDEASTANFTVETGVQAIVPKYIYAFPIIFQENLIGVIIFGSTYRFGDITKGLIESVIPQIGVAITNAQNLEQTQQLSCEISQKHAELNVKTQELEKAYRVKSDFLSNMSHELRTPLNSIIGFTSILLGEHGDPLTSDQRKALEKVLKNGRHLLQLINDILDFSKIESGRMHISIETESVESVVAGAIMTTEHLIRQKNLELKDILAQNLPLFRTDVLKVKQIIVNLLSNASKFTDQGVIEVRAWQDKGLVYISVKDSGIGIEPQNIDKIFEEFQQIDTSHSRKYKGTGLGLPIARRLARLLGGDLVVESEIGKGSTFILSVPPELPKSSAEGTEQKSEKAIPAPAPAPLPMPPKVIPAAPADLPSVQKQPVEMLSALKSQEITPSIEPSSHAGAKVLCIDDEPDVIEILRNYLTPEGYTVFSANNGFDGLKLAEKLQPNVITLDIQMPEKDGWQVLRELKANPFTRDIPVLIHSIVENKPLAFSLGAVDYMPKPADASVVIRLVKKAITSTDNYILVVEDEIDYSILIQKFLKDAGYSVDYALNGKEAIDKVQQNIPALILLDLKMPVMDGFEVMRHLKENPKWQMIPVIIITGMELNTEQRDEIESKTINFLRKADYTMESLSQLIKRSLTPN
ncbi:MAG: response regulator [Bacteroidetes bacterium]|nr:response regulator [Bacteroidota bacterium]